MSSESSSRDHSIHRQSKVDDRHSAADEYSDDEWWNDGANTHQRNEAAQARLTQWPEYQRTNFKAKSKAAHISTQLASRAHTRRYSVQKPSREKSRHRQRLQNAQAGIKVITNFSRHHGPTPIAHGSVQSTQPSKRTLDPGAFFDLAALQEIDNRPREISKSNWSSSMRPVATSNYSTALLEDTNTFTGQFQQNSSITRLGSRRARGLVPSPIRLEHELSPSDRPIVIGISVPSAKLSHHVTSPYTAAESGRRPRDDGLMVPETPTIIITPAQKPSNWYSAANNQNARPTSSIYSRQTALFDRADRLYSPTLPTLNSPQFGLEQSVTARNISKARASVATEFDGDVTPDSPFRPRIMSSCTIFEEDTTPIVAKELSPTSASSIRHTSVAVDPRMSKGWWNYIVTPFLSRSSTLGSPCSVTSDRPAMPNLQTAVHPSVSTDEKTLSPETPQTSTTIASDVWWEKRNTTDGSAKQLNNQIISPGGYDDQSGTLPFMLAPSATVLERQRQAGARQVLARDQSMKSVLSPSDRETPVVLDVASLASSPYSPDQGNVIDAQLGHHVTPTAIRTIEIPRHSPQPVVQILGPPPYSPPRQQIPRYRAFFPPGHQMSLQQPSSPSPLSPGLQQAMSSRGAIPMSEVPLTPAGRGRITFSDVPTFEPPPKKALKVEKKRSRHEKEDSIAHKAGGLWRGRGCIPDSGCYGRTGPVGRRRRRCCCGWIFGAVALIVLIVVLATQLHHASPPVQQSQWLNITGFPPIFRGLSTIAAPTNTVSKTSCVFPTTLWSCSLPKEIQQPGMTTDTPNFRIQIQWDNSTAANATFLNVTGNPNLPIRSAVGKPVSAAQFIRRALSLQLRAPPFNPSPAPPSLAEQAFLGNTTDGITSSLKAGEPTPFYVSFLPTTSGPGNTPGILKRQNSSDPFPNISSLIPPASTNVNGTAAPANLLPLPSQQPIRLYDRGLPTEHYGFYTYFDRSIFLKSTALLNASNIGQGEVPDDENGGSTEAAAMFRCTWAQTRFLVQIWTRKGQAAALLNATSQATLLSSASNYTSAVANDFSSPGSFPYPVTVTLDRHGGDSTLKSIYCYTLDAREQPVASSGKFWPEHRDSGGTIINPAPGLFGDDTSDPSLGGYDGGTSGCGCQWQNWQGVTSG